ncbi:MAG: hypothetical protein GF350_00600, partial [Chitinivibrionales bacterium]|nr:hypothetical protein [Chitinivibrionales bacterium]
TIPGGGEIAAGVSESITSPVRGPSVEYETGLSLSYTQPLLKGAWKYAEQDYAVTIARYDSREFTLNQQKKILEKISGIRQQYWSLYEKARRRDIYIGEKTLNEKRLATERKRFAVGGGTQMDTLSAALELLKAEQNYLNAQYELSLAKKNIAADLSIATDTISLDTSVSVEVFDPPPAHEFIAMAERFDPQLKIYRTLREKLAFESEKLRNDKLPSVNLEASWSRTARDSLPLGAGSYLASSNLVKLIFSYSIPSKKKTIAEKLGAIDRKENRLEWEQYKRELAVRLSDLLEQWDKEKQDLLIAVKAEEIAAQLLEAARAGYAIGTVDNLSYLKAQNEYSRAAIERLEKEVVLKRIEILFDRVTGMALTKFGVTFQ